MERVGIVDVGVGNVSSLIAAFESMDIKTERITIPSKISLHSKLILPGVGNFGAFMQAVRLNRFEEPLSNFALEAKLPILGICVGAQALFESSDESPQSLGLGLISGTNVLITEENARNTPRVGWDYIDSLINDQDPNSSARTQEFLEGRYFFSHSYRFSPNNHKTVLARSRISRTIPAIVRQENIIGVQFHPERSLDAGRNFLRAFYLGKLNAT